jgi:hypothetical protein
MIRCARRFLVLFVVQAILFLGGQIHARAVMGCGQPPAGGSLSDAQSTRSAGNVAQPCGERSHIDPDLVPGSAFAWGLRASVRSDCGALRLVAPAEHVSRSTALRQAVALRIVHHLGEADSDLPSSPKVNGARERDYDGPSTCTTALRFVATKAGGKTEIWRAVEPDELADLIGSGKYRPGPGNEGKYFFPTKAQAKNLADNILPGRKFCITSGCIDSSVLAKIDKIYPAGEGQAWFIPNELLPYIDNIVVHGPA